MWWEWTQSNFFLIWPRKQFVFIRHKMSQLYQPVLILPRHILTFWHVTMYRVPVGIVVWHDKPSPTRSRPVAVRGQRAKALTGAQRLTPHVSHPDAQTVHCFEFRNKTHLVMFRKWLLMFGLGRDANSGLLGKSHLRLLVNSLQNTLHSTET